MSNELDDILNVDDEHCQICGNYGCEDCEDYEYCEMCGGEHGEHEVGCPNDNSSFALLCREGYD